LWVTDNGLHGSQGRLTPIDPKTGKPGPAIPVADLYNLYFTPDGRSAIVVDERLRRLDFREPQEMNLQLSIPTPQCPGIDHGDFSIDGRYAIFTCEFHNGGLIKVDIAGHKVVGHLDLATPNQPQDIRVSPDGKVFYVADMKRS
jgi:DNA-binding beta-propeller fold protein YncE